MVDFRVIMNNSGGDGIDSREEQALIRNLNDAGCTPDIIKLFIECQKSGNLAEQLLFLSKQRRQLLEQIHHIQHQLEYLDYLIYIIKEKKRREMEDDIQ